MPYINSDQVKEKRNAIKKAFPEFKFSITRDNHSGIRIVVLEGPVWFANDGDHDQVNPYHINGKNDRQNEALEKMYAIANRENGTEVMDSDYGRVPNFYVWMEIGRWDKPYKVREEKKAEAKDEEASIKFEAGEVLTGNATENEIASFLKEISGLDTEEEKPEPESAPELSFHSVFGGMGERKPIETEGMLLHKYLDAATRAHNGVSFDPERRGKQYVRDYSNLLAEDLKEVEKYGGDTERYREKFERLFLDWMGSKANCISSMITGPARFPTARAQKRNDWERNKANALEDWRQRAIKAIKKKHKRENAPDPMQAAKRKFHQEEAMLERMKSANKVIKSKKLSEEDKISRLLDQGFSEGSARNLLTPDFANRIGFASWQLTNCRNRMKSAQAKVEELERRANTPDVEQEREDGIKVVENAAENRLQVFFPGKPEYEMRQKLKSNGFRWAPSKGCWQAYLNNRSIEKLANILD